MNGTEVMEKTLPFDIADLLDDGDAMAAYLSEAFATDDPQYVVHALTVIERARDAVGRNTDADGTRSIDAATIAPLLTLVRAVGLRLAVTPLPAD